MITCVECGTTNVEVTANAPRSGSPRWHGRCLDCGAGWDFDD